jgi:hypothetical protein
MCGGLRASSELPIIIENDCSKVVDVVKSVGQDRSCDLHCFFIISQGRECVFVKAERSQVRISHGLANFARLEHHSATWLGSGPEAILQDLDHDRLVTHLA